MSSPGRATCATQGANSEVEPVLLMLVDSVAVAVMWVPDGAFIRLIWSLSVLAMY